MAAAKDRVAVVPGPAPIINSRSDTFGGGDSGRHSASLQSLYETPFWIPASFKVVKYSSTQVQSGGVNGSDDGDGLISTRNRLLDQMTKFVAAKIKTAKIMHKIPFLRNVIFGISF